jgi:hypothetical protein
MRMQSSWGRLGSNNRNLHGAAHASTIKAEIQYAGVDLTVTTPGVAGSWTVRFLPQLLAAESGDLANGQGAANLASGLPMNFICSGDTVIAFQDQIGPFDGHTWTVINTQCESMQGVFILRHVSAQRI